jgi:signal transduction histidine kinase
MSVSRDVSEKERLQKTLELLNKAALPLQKSRTQEEIFAATAEELRGLNAHAVFMLFNDQKTAGKIVYAAEREVLKKMKGFNVPVSGLEFPLDQGIYKDLIKKKKEVYSKNVKDAIQKMVKPDRYELCERIVNFLGITHKKVIIVPLVIHEDTRGVLIVISDDITEDDTQSLRAFANQVSLALENARHRKESQSRTDELAEKLKQQEMLRELNTELFLAQSQEEVLDAAIEGIHQLGKSFSNISLLNNERTHARIVRFKIDKKLLKAIEKVARTVIPGWSIAEYEVPVWEEDNIYYKFFEAQIPLVTSNVPVSGHPVLKTELSDIYAGFATRDYILQNTIKVIAKMMPYESVMVFPIRIEGRTIGTLTVTSRDIFTQGDFELMNTVGEVVSSALERVIQSEKLKKTLDELRAVQKINTLLNTGASLEQILDHISSSIKEVYHYEFAYPLLLDPSRRYLTFTYASVPPQLEKKINKALGVALKDFRYPITENFSLFQIITGKTCLISKGFEELADTMPDDGFGSTVKKLSSDLSKALGMKPGENSVMVAPLPYREETIGVLFVGHKQQLSEKDFQQLEYFLDQVGIAIAKAEVESKLRQSLKDLRELDQMKSDFIDIASHELRTPLTTLKLYLEMMVLEQYGHLSESLRNRIQVMEEGVSRLEEIINQTLVASRLLKNKLELNKNPVSLVEIATDVVNQLQPLWKTKNQNIFIENPPDLSLVEGDKRALFTVINNLVDNALRYSPNDTEIFIKFAEHPGEVECMVQDQGCGIPPEHQGKVFDEFYIVPSETEYARMDGRTGLGLFVTKGIIEQHGGKIWVESTAGEGSVFHFALHTMEGS